MANDKKDKEFCSAENGVKLNSWFPDLQYKLLFFVNEFPPLALGLYLNIAFAKLIEQIKFSSASN